MPYLSTDEHDRRIDALKQCSSVRQAAQLLNIEYSALNRWTHDNWPAYMERQRHKQRITRKCNTNLDNCGVKMGQALNKDGCDLVKGFFRWLLRARERNKIVDVCEVMKAYRQYASGR